MRKKNPADKCQYPNIYIIEDRISQDSLAPLKILQSISSIEDFPKPLNCNTI